ncbi:hypothetical protein MCOR34_002087 [Pyricularia oryzae]|nr:hypothetical protein MCOR34_002087 [Pyricularia oryzae]
MDFVPISQAPQNKAPRGGSGHGHEKREDEQEGGAEQSIVKEKIMTKKRNSHNCERVRRPEERIWSAWQSKCKGAGKTE